MKWYKRDPDAWLGGVVGMPPDERGIYDTVIDVLYSRDLDVPAPNDDRFWSRACCCDPRTWRRIRDKLIARGKLYLEPNGNLMARRVRDEHERAARRIEVMSELRQKQIEKQHSATESTPGKPQPEPDKKEHGDQARPSNVRALVSEAASDLAEEIAAIAGFPTPKDWPPGWCGAPMRVQAMLDGGWNREIMLAEARATMARKRDGPPSSVVYFEKAFARAHARQAAPLPAVETSGATNGKIRENTFAAALRRLGERADELDGGLHEGGPAPPGMLPDRRRE